MKIDSMEHTQPEEEPGNKKKEFLVEEEQKELAELAETGEVDEELGGVKKDSEIPEEELAEKKDLREWMSELRDEELKEGEDSGVEEATAKEVEEHKEDPVEIEEANRSLVPVETDVSMEDETPSDGYVSVPMTKEQIKEAQEKLKKWPHMGVDTKNNAPEDEVIVGTVDEGPEDKSESMKTNSGEALEDREARAVEGVVEDITDDPATVEEVAKHAKDSSDDTENDLEINAEFAKRFPGAVDIMKKSPDEITDKDANVLRGFIRAQKGIVPGAQVSNRAVYAEAQGFFRDNAGEKPPEIIEYVALPQQPPVVETAPPVEETPPVENAEENDGMDEVVREWLKSEAGEGLSNILKLAEKNPKMGRAGLEKWYFANMEDKDLLDVLTYVGDIIEDIDAEVERNRQREARVNTPPTTQRGPEGTMFTMPEIEVSDEDLVKFRKRMIERIGVIENIRIDKESTWSHLNIDFARLKGLSSMRFKDENIEAELKAEFMARIELNAVGLYWEEVRTAIMSSEDSYYDVMKKSMSGCPILSVGTYDWLRSQESYKTIENGHGVETLQLTQEIDLSIAEIYRRMTALKPAVGAVDERLDLWLAGEDENMRMVEQMATKLGVSEGSVRLAWSLIEAECWMADVKGTHPAYKVCSFSKSRIENYKAGLGVSAGIRLVQEYREANPRVAKGDIPDDIFEIEGVSWARTGLRAWPGAQQAAEGGQYLAGMSRYIESSGVKISPQLLVMEGLGFGVAAHDALDGIVGAKLGESSSSAFGGITGKLFLALMRVEGKGSVNVEGAAVAPKVGKLLNQWVRSYLWGESWANEEVNDTNGLKNFPPTAELFSHFRDLVLAYDADADEGRGEGEVVGSGQGSEQSKRDAREFSEWFYGLTLKLGVILRDSYQRVGIPNGLRGGANRRTDDIKGMRLFEADYWMGKRLSDRVRISKSDPRWWLRK